MQFTLINDKARARTPYTSMLWMFEGSSLPSTLVSVKNLPSWQSNLAYSYISLWRHTHTAVIACDMYGIIIANPNGGNILLGAA